MYFKFNNTLLLFFFWYISCYTKQYNRYSHNVICPGYSSLLNELVGVVCIGENLCGFPVFFCFNVIDTATKTKKIYPEKLILS